MKKPPFHIPNCDHAQLLVNPRALYLLQQGGRPSHQVLRHPGAYSDPGTVGYYYQLANARLGNSTDYRQLADWYVQDNYGQFEYFFTVVKCGHCSLCLHHRQLDIVNRCRMESELYDAPPYCFCLTYDDAHLPGKRQDAVPMPVGRIVYRDVQLWLKRLRRIWDRRGICHNIRYLVACEYGSKRRRPHYHVILWNNPLGADEWHPAQQHQLMKDIHDAWQMDSWHVFSQPDNFRPAGDGAAAYASKYALKQSTYRLTHHLPPEYPAPSMHMSIGHGGIGRPFIERFRLYFEANLTVDRLTWTSRHDGRVHWCRIGSYVNSVLHPSPSRQVPALVKQSYRELCSILEVGVRDAVLDPGYARFLSSALRPPHLPNLLPTLSGHLARCTCPLYKSWKANLLWQPLEWLNNYLSSYLIAPQPINLKSYYDYIAVQLSSSDRRGSLAGDAFRSDRDQAVLESKSRL